MTACPSLFCFGLGYSARALARSLLREGWRIAGTTRSGHSPGPDLAVEVVAFDGLAPIADAATVLAGVSHILVSIPPEAEGDPVLAHHALDLARLSGLSWLGYLSATSVYGEGGGAPVDETSPLAPTSARGRRRLAAERAWLDLHRQSGLPVHVFRLAAIYGPGRSPLDQLRAGTARRIDKPGHRFARIHVEEIVAVLRASIERPAPGAIYNLCDDEPAEPADVVSYASRLLGVEPPPLEPFASACASLSPMARSFWQDRRTLANARMHDLLGRPLAYPSYRQGLAAIARAEARDLNARAEAGDLNARAQARDLKK